MNFVSVLLARNRESIYPFLNYFFNQIISCGSAMGQFIFNFLTMKCYLAKTDGDFKFISSLFNPRNTAYMIRKKTGIEQLKKWSGSPVISIYVLTIGNKKIGWFSIKRSDNLKEGEFGMMINEPYRNKGYGRQMMKLIEEEAKKLGIKKMKLQVFEDNKPAIKVYKKSGYKETHRLIAMEKKLK